MRVVPVNSSNLQAVGYDAATKTLRVVFKAGTVYEYADVPPELHADLMKAESVGKYFSANVKTKFPFKKLEAV